jgi:hypothetical protein
MYVGPHVGSVVDLQRQPRRCQWHGGAVSQPGGRRSLGRTGWLAGPVGILLGEALGKQDDLG